MERDASLDEFLDTSPAGDDQSEAADTTDEQPSAAADQPAATTAEPDTGETTVEPAAVTARWDPDGEPCADCGEVVNRRWRDGEAFFCTDCKEW